MKDFSKFIRTGTHKEFVDDAEKIIRMGQSDKTNKLLKFLGMYYCSDENGKYRDKEVLQLLLFDDKIIEQVPEEFTSILTREAYTTLAFCMKDKKFYKTGEKRGVF